MPSVRRDHWGDADQRPAISQQGHGRDSTVGIIFELPRQNGGHAVAIQDLAHDRVEGSNRALFFRFLQRNPAAERRKSGVNAGHIMEQNPGLIVVLRSSVPEAGK